MQSDPGRRRAIAEEARRRAAAWADPDGSGSVTPVSRRPATSDEAGVATRNAGANAPIVVGESAEFVQRRNGRATQGGGTALPKAAWANDPGVSGEPSRDRAYGANDGGAGSARRAGNPPLSALHYDGVRREDRRAPSAASPYDCPACRSRYDGTNGSRGDSSSPSRLPVLLVPCGHTLCRACIRAWAQRQQDGSTHPTCPLCESAFSGTAINQAVAAFVEHANARDDDVARSSADVVAQATAAASRDLAPLPPMLRRQLHAFATDDDRAMRAEQAARVAMSHERLAELRRREAAMAIAELEDAVSAAKSQHAVEGALSGELTAIEAELKRLELERAVVLSQLGEVLQKRSRCGVREHECRVRSTALESVARVHADTAHRYRSATLDLVPSDAVAEAMSDAARSARAEMPFASS